MNEAELKKMREEDDKWTGPKLILLAIATLITGFSVIYIISGFNGGH